MCAGSGRPSTRRLLGADALGRAVAADGAGPARRRSSPAWRSRSRRRRTARPPPDKALWPSLVSCTRLASRSARSPMKCLRGVAIARADIARTGSASCRHRSPSTSRCRRASPARLGRRDVLLLGVDEGPDFIDLDALAGQVRAGCGPGSPQHASPASASSLTMVFLLAPVRRAMARRDTPSTIMPRISARFSRASLFIPTLMLEAPRRVKTYLAN